MAPPGSLVAQSYGGLNLSHIAQKPCLHAFYGQQQWCPKKVILPSFREVLYHLIYSIKLMGYACCSKIGHVKVQLRKIKFDILVPPGGWQQRHPTHNVMLSESIMCWQSENMERTVGSACCNWITCLQNGILLSVQQHPQNLEACHAPVGGHMT